MKKCKKKSNIRYMNSYEKPENKTLEKPEEEGEKEVFTSIVRVLGRKYEDISEKEREEVFKNMEEIFRDQPKVRKVLLEAFGSPENVPDELARTMFYERKKTPQEIAIIELVNKKTNELRKKFGLPDLNVSSENVYVLPKDAFWPKDIGGSGFYYPMLQFIAIRDQCEQDTLSSGYPKLIFLADLVHEMVHFKSYNTLKKLEGSDSYYPHKIGLESFLRKDANQSFFLNLNEAIIQEMAIGIVKELERHPFLIEEVAERERVKKILAGKKTDEGKPFIVGDEYYLNNKLWMARFGNERERKILNLLVDKIYQKDLREGQGKYNDREEIFEVFAKAAITGKILELGKLIDKNFGSGSFRKIGELDKDLNQLEDYVASLK